MRSLMLIAAAGALLFTSCTSDSESNSPSDGPGLEINGPADVDMTTIADVPLGGSTADTADIPPDSSSNDTTPVTDAPSTTVAPTTAAPTTTFAPYESEIYGDPANWICRADTTDVCDDPYPVTEVAADLTVSDEPSLPAIHPPIDCFYVYPTVSGDPSFNSDLVADNEIGTTQVQAARFNQVCTVFAPIYRSVTAGGLFGGVDGDFATGWRMAYEDVRDSWRYYLANLNQGRPVVILAHSQGSFHVTTLLSEEIDPSPAQRDLLVSAIFPGTSFQVAPGSNVGGDTQNLPLCSREGEFGCLITFQTYRDAEPPTPGALFGQPGVGTESACVNPGNLAGGEALLDASLPAGDWLFADPANSVLTEPRVGVPGLITGECKTTAEGYKFLSITVNSDPTDPRGDDIPGDGSPNWGLHGIDMNIAQDTLIDVVRAQAEAYLAAR